MQPEYPRHRFSRGLLSILEIVLLKPYISIFYGKLGETVKNVKSIRSDISSHM
jgi:hypothetical protein